MKKIISIILVFPVLLAVFSCFASMQNDDDKNVFTCLIAGLDEASENTDVLSVFAYNKIAGKSSIVQIPRDTYSLFKGNYGKINSIYPYLRKTGYSPDDSMSSLMEAVEGYLGVNIDGYTALTMSAFVNIVDTLGGIYVDVPSSFDVSAFNGKIKHGRNHLTGEASMLLVRHRDSYALGDIARLNAQKIFLEGLYNTALREFDITKMLTLAAKAEGVILDINVLKLSRMLIGGVGIKNSKLSIATLPGRATISCGISYYVVSRHSAMKATRELLFATGEFDPQKRLNNVYLKEIDSIYNDGTVSYKIYYGGKTVEIQ